jgi:hypothetical protein
MISSNIESSIRPQDRRQATGTWYRRNGEIRTAEFDIVMHPQPTRTHSRTTTILVIEFHANSYDTLIGKLKRDGCLVLEDHDKPSAVEIAPDAFEADPSDADRHEQPSPAQLFQAIQAEDAGFCS